MVSVVKALAITEWYFKNLDNPNDWEHSEGGIRQELIPKSVH
jgi:hypothetical protein